MFLIWLVLIAVSAANPTVREDCPACPPTACPSGMPIWCYDQPKPDPLPNCYCDPAPICALAAAECPVAPVVA